MNNINYSRTFNGIRNPRKSYYLRLGGFGYPADDISFLRKLFYNIGNYAKLKRVNL